jgi:hypothetical protein
VASLNAPALFVVGVDFSDHRSFYCWGYEAVMVTDTAFYRNPHYHKPSDRPHTLRLCEGCQGRGWPCPCVESPFLSQAFPCLFVRHPFVASKRGARCRTLRSGQEGYVLPLCQCSPDASPPIDRPAAAWNAHPLSQFPLCQANK